MNAKKYLLQLERLDTKINQKIDELRSLKEAATNISTKADGMPHASNASDKIGNIVSKYIDLQEEINREIDLFVEKKHAIINQIHTLPNKSMVVLFERYVNYKTLEQIAGDMQLSYDYVRHLHRKALDEFNAIIEWKGRINDD